VIVPAVIGGELVRLDIGRRAVGQLGLTFLGTAAFRAAFFLRRWNPSGTPTLYGVRLPLKAEGVSPFRQRSSLLGGTSPAPGLWCWNETKCLTRFP
jgi:hypothetical protein